MYRALLKQTASLGHAILNSTSIRSTIRNRFRKDKKILSPSKAANGLKAGYEAYDLVHQALHGSAAAISRLGTLVASTRSLHEAQDKYREELRAVQPPPSPRYIRKSEHAHKLMSKEYQKGRLNHAKPVLERPLPFEELNGRPRRVPQFVVASGSAIPFLRYGKPQSIMLSRVLRQKLAQYESWQAEKLHNEFLWSWTQDEDQWDSLIISQMKHEAVHVSDLPATADEPNKSWGANHEEVAFEISEKIMGFMSKNRAMGAKLWAIMEKEKKLAKIEKGQTKAKAEHEPSTVMEQSP